MYLGEWLLIGSTVLLIVGLLNLPRLERWFAPPRPEAPADADDAPKPDPTEDPSPQD